MPTDCWLRSIGGRRGLGRVLRYKRVAAARANREMMAGVGRGENSNWRRNSMMLGHTDTDRQGNTDTHGVSEVPRLSGFRCSKGQAAFRRYSALTRRLLLGQSQQDLCNTYFSKCDPLKQLPCQKPEYEAMSLKERKLPHESQTVLMDKLISSTQLILSNMN